MGRHTGFWTSRISLGVAAAIVSLIIAKSDGSHATRTLFSSSVSRPPDGHLATGADRDFSPERLSPPADPLRMVCRVSVPAGSLLVIGSLDTTGAAHQFHIHVGTERTMSRDRASDSHSHEETSVSAVFVPLHTPMVAEHAGEAAIHNQEQADSTVRFCTAEKTSSAIQFANSGDFGKNESDRPAKKSDRVFLVPHFEQQAVIHQSTESTVIVTGKRVAVFVDNHLAALSADTEAAKHIANSEIRDAACRVCETIEAGLIETVSAWIGEIPDIDGDGRLSVVFSDLDRRRPSDEVPILGCVRDRDFSRDSSADFAGDIIYLDYRIPRGDELRALLAHELTHAAIASMHLEFCPAGAPAKVSPIPPWLNEAAAHWVELQFCSVPMGFAWRVKQFRSHTEACPIVACESKIPLTTRRAGSRIAAAGFLRRFVSDPAAVGKLLRDPRPFEEAVSIASGESFEHLFRVWSVEQAQSILGLSAEYPIRRLEQDESIRCHVRGTAFSLLQCAGVSEVVTITCAANAKPQVTVVSP